MAVPRKALTGAAPRAPAVNKSAQPPPTFIILRCSCFEIDTYPSTFGRNKQPTASRRNTSIRVRLSSQFHRCILMTMPVHAKMSLTLGASRVLESLGPCPRFVTACCWSQARCDGLRKPKSDIPITEFSWTTMASSKQRLGSLHSSCLINVLLVSLVTEA
jgi:hypothetical protein